MSKDIPFERALEAARTEYYVDFKGKEYSAELLGKKFNINQDELRDLIKNSKFKPNKDMIEFFDLDEDDLQDVDASVYNFVKEIEKYNQK